MKWLWSDVPDGLMFHLEDDWTCKERIDLARVRDMMSGKTAAVSLLTSTHGDKGQGDFSVGRRKFRVLGIRIWCTPIPLFNTSPGFFDGQFARACSELMTPDLDPEKQMRPPFNMPLLRFLSGHECRFYKSADGSPVIEDIGREWQIDNDVSKLVKAGKSTWQLGASRRMSGD